MDRKAAQRRLTRATYTLILIACFSTQAAVAKIARPCLPSPTPALTESPAGGRQAEPQSARELLPGTPIEQELKGGETRSFSVELSGGQYLKVSVRQEGIDAEVRLFGPDGQKIADVDNDPAGGTEYVVAVAAVPGRYRLDVLSPDKGAAAGSFKVRIEELREAAERDRTQVRAAGIFEAAERLRAQQTAESLREAIEKYAEALPLWREAGDKRGEAYTLNQTGLVYSRTGEAKRAVEYYEQSVALWREVGDRLNEATELTNIGTAYWRMGDSQKALEFNGRALPLAEAGGFRETEALTLNNIGADYWALGQPQEALKYYGRVLPLSQDRRQQAVTLNNMATVSQQMGELQRAVEYLNRSLPLRKAAGDRQGESNTLHNLGRIYEELGETQQALQYFNQALLLTEAVGDHQGEAFTLRALSELYRSLADMRGAREYSVKALELSRAVGDRRSESYELNDLGMVDQSTGEPRKALDHFGQALSVAREVGDKWAEINVLNNLGDAYARAGDAAKALESHGEALELSRETHIRMGEAASLYGLARALTRTGDLAQARSRIEAALEIVESTRTKVAGAELRTSYLASNEELYRFYVDLLMRMHREQPSGGFDAAALQASERARARGLLDMLAEARADIRQGVDPELLARERSLQRQLNTKADRLTRLLGAKHTQEQAEAASKEVESTLADYREAESQIRARSPRYAALTQPQPLSLEEIQRMLDADTILLEYALGEERSYLWAVTPTSLTSYELPRREEIESAARQVYDLLVAKSDSLHPESLSGLSRTLLGPVADQLGRKRLLVVAPGALQYVPFGALPTPRLNRQASPGGGGETSQPLIATHEVVSLPSASVLASLRRESSARAAAPKKVAVFADPVFARDDPRVKTRVGGERATAGDGAKNYVGQVATSASQVSPPSDVERSASDLSLSGFERLPVSRREAELITGLVPAAQSFKALDFAASRAAATSAEMSRYRIVHFATHSLLDNAHPELSGIVLSLVDERGEPQDGFLRLNEIYNLKLNADLVVLSACQTALGKEIRGEGLVGLTRGFMYAGAPRVVATLWKVSDAATAELMRRFYRNMLDGGMRPAAALRAAQGSLRRERQWAAPYYWAGFIIQGEWR